VAVFGRLGLLQEAEKDDDRAVEAAIAQLCQVGVRALEADQLNRPGATGVSNDTE
jgi:hypothetical protein